LPQNFFSRRNRESFPAPSSSTSQFWGKNQINAKIPLKAVRYKNFRSMVMRFEEERANSGWRAFGEETRPAGIAVWVQCKC